MNVTHQLLSRRLKGSKIGGMKYHKFFAAPILAAALLMLSPTVALARVSGGGPPPASGSCSQVGQQCNPNQGSTKIFLSSSRETALMYELNADAQSNHSIAIKLGTLANEICTYSPSTWFESIVHGGTQGTYTIVKTETSVTAAAFVTSAINELGVNNSVVGEIEGTLSSSGYNFTYTVGTNSPGVVFGSSNGTSPNGTSGSSCPGISINPLSWFAAPTCVTGQILGFLSHAVAALLDPTLLLKYLYNFSDHLLMFSFLKNTALKTWITFGQKNNAVLYKLYLITMPLGFMVAIVAAAARVVKETRDRRSAGSMVIMGSATSALIGLTVIGLGEGLALDLYQLSNTVALDLMQAFGNSSLPFNNNGSFTLLGQDPIFGWLMMIISLIVVVGVFLWLMVKFLIRVFIIWFSITLLPIAVGFAVYDLRNDLFQQWLKHFLGALAGAALAVIGIQLTLGIWGAALKQVTLSSGVESALWEIAAVGFLVMGTSATAKLMSVGYGGVRGEAGVLGTGLGLAAGVAGAVSLMGKGATVAKGVAKVHAAPVKALAKGGRASVGGAKSTAAKVSMARSGTSPKGIYKHLTSREAKSFAGTEGAAETALASDPFSAEMVQRATHHMPGGTSMHDRVAMMASNKEYRPLMRQWLAGGHMARIARGEDPKTITTNFSSKTQQSMLDQASEASQTHFKNHINDRNPFGSRSFEPKPGPATAPDAGGGK